MKPVSKFLSLIICFGLIISLCSVSYAVPSESDDGISVIPEWIKAVGILNEDFELSHKDYVTKGEVAYIAASLAGFENADASGKIFSDVSVGDMYAGAIEMLANSGVISGKGDGTFGIEQYITVDEAVKIFVSILGFDVKAQYSGGYPVGYLAVASDIKLLRGMTKSSGLLTADNLAVILDNIVEIDVPVFSSISSGRVDYSFEKGKTILTENHHIYTNSGMITGNSVSSFDGNELEENYVVIDGFGKVDASLTDADAYLGHYVDYFVGNYDDKNECELLYIRDNEANKVSVIDADNVCPEKTSVEAIGYYDESDRLKSISLSDDARIIYNGVFEVNITPDMLTPAMGRLVVTDADSDGRADTVSVEDAEIAIVESVDVTNEKLYVKYSDKVYDLETVTRKVKIRNSREDMAMKYINSGDVISVCESRNGNYISITVSNIRIQGTIDSVSEEEITVDGVEYKISPYYSALALRSDIYVPEVKVGFAGTFYVDGNGDIAYISEGNSDGYIYAYLLSAYADSGLSEKVRFKVFMQTGDIMELDAVEKLKVCGIAVKQADEIMDAISDGGEVKRQLVKIKLNSEGLLSELWLATETDEKIGYDLEHFSHDYGVKSLQHRYGAMGTKYRVDGQTIVFTVPSDASDYKDYSIVAASTLLDSFIYDKASIYDADENKIARVLVLYDMQGGGGLDVALYQTKISIVDSIGTAVDSNGDTTYVLHHYTNGVGQSNRVKNPEGKNVYSRYWRYDGIRVADLKPGDIVQLRLNGVGEIETFHVLYRGEQTYAEYSSSGAPTVDWFTGAMHTAYGVVKDKVSKRLTVNAHGNGEDFNWNREFIVDGIPVFIWDTKERVPCTHGTIHDINIGDKVFVKTVNNAAREVVVFR